MDLRKITVEERARIEQMKPLFVKLCDMFNGRCTFFAVVFTVAGIILAFTGKLTSQYVLFVGAIQALLVAHSAKEDYHDRSSTSVDSTKGTTSNG